MFKVSAFCLNHALHCLTGVSTYNVLIKFVSSCEKSGYVNRVHRHPDPFLSPYPALMTTLCCPLDLDLGCLTVRNEVWKLPFNKSTFVFMILWFCILACLSYTRAIVICIIPPSFSYCLFLQWMSTVVQCSINFTGSLKREIQSTVTAADSSDGGISVLNHCLLWSKFVNTHLYQSRQWFNIHLNFYLLTYVVCNLVGTQ